VRARSPRPEEAEDCLHEALVRLAARPVLDVDSAGLRALVVRTACSLAIDRWRRERCRERLLARLAVGAVAESPEARVADRSEAAWLAGGMVELGSIERAALLHAVDGHHVGEIAHLLGIGYKSAENALGRARRKLRLRAAAAAAALAGLLRRVMSRQESAQAAVVVVPVLAALLLLPGGAPSQPPMQASSGQHAAAMMPPAVPAIHARLTAHVLPAGSASEGGADVRQAAPTSATSAPQPPSRQNPGVLYTPIGGVGIAQNPDGGPQLVVVAGFTLVSGPSTALNVGPIHSWYQATHMTCAVGDPTCPPIKVG
jgi:DNA-directed RNA polymerase specialized sigma24 family protein